MSEVLPGNNSAAVQLTASERLRAVIKSRPRNGGMSGSNFQRSSLVPPVAAERPVDIATVTDGGPKVSGSVKPGMSEDLFVNDSQEKQNNINLATQPQPQRMLPMQPRFAVPSAPVRATKNNKVVRTPEESRKRLFKQLDISSLGQILLCVPTAFVDCTTTLNTLAGLPDGFKGLFYLRRTGRVEALDANKRSVAPTPHGTLYDAPYYTHWRLIRSLKVELVDRHGDLVWVTFFDPWRWKNSDHLGFLLIDGTLQTFHNRRMLFNTMEPPPEVAGKVWARYNLPGGPKEEEVRKAIWQALEDPESFGKASFSLITSSLLSEQQLLDLAIPVMGAPYESLRELFLSLHQPSHTHEGELAAEVARMMAVTGVCNAAKAASMRYPNFKSPINITMAQVHELIKNQPETLTGDQSVAIETLVTALKSPKPLNGLLSGDVGTGKTLVFLIPAVAVHLAGGQVALVSPTEILANQLAANLQRRFPMAKVERVFAGGKIRNQSAILVGTSGLGSVTKKFNYTPNFLVVDEQHKLATKDRNSMVGPWTHHLEASATPIPRSLAATLFNGTQVFTLNDAPVARQIDSFVISETERASVVGWMRQAIEQNQRVAVIYPRVEKSCVVDPLDERNELDRDLLQAARLAGPLISSVTDAAEVLDRRFPGRVGMLHGKLPAATINQTLDDFRSGLKPIVVASTIMETGIDIPDIRLLVVKNADNFGAAQLHQLRGRLARNGGAARFVMMVNDIDQLAPETLERLQMVSQTTNGYELAAADMNTRGFGDLAGLTQSGQVSCAFRLLKLTVDDFCVIAKNDVQLVDYS